MFKDSTNVTDKIATELAEQIVLSELPSGARIQELKLAQQMGVSRGSVREALLILERQHLIEIYPRRGAVVNDMTQQEALDVIDLFADLSKRWWLELVSLSEAPSVLRQARPLVDAMEMAARNESVRELLVARVNYHAAILEPAHRYLRALFESLLPSTQRIVAALVRQGGLDGYDIARLYRAVHDAGEDQCVERIVELIDAFHARLLKLCRRHGRYEGGVRNINKNAAFFNKTVINSAKLH